MLLYRLICRLAHRSRHLFVNRDGDLTNASDIRNQFRPNVSSRNDGRRIGQSNFRGLTGDVDAYVRFGERIARYFLRFNVLYFINGRGSFQLRFSYLHGRRFRPIINYRNVELMRIQIFFGRLRYLYTSEANETRGDCLFLLFVVLCARRWGAVCFSKLVKYPLCRDSGYEYKPILDIPLLPAGTVTSPPFAHSPSFFDERPRYLWVRVGS